MPLFDSYPEAPDPNVIQIKLDLKRTFVAESIFTDEFGIHDKMFRILVSYSKRNPSVGYCQGMNCLVGMILMVVTNEEDAFWLFCTLIETILPLDYYSLMLEVLIDQKVLMQLIKLKNPKFLKQYSDLEVELVMKSYQWFICLYSLNFSKNISQIVWDMLFLDGDWALFKCAFVLMELQQQDYTGSDLVKGYFKYSDITSQQIKKLRKKFRKSTISEQKDGYSPDLITASINDNQSSLFRRVKLLNKFVILSKGFKDIQGGDQVGKEELIFDGRLECNVEHPMCLYDFTNRCKILHFLIYRVSKPWKVINNYFGDDDITKATGGMDTVRNIFGIAKKIEVNPGEKTATFIKCMRKSIMKGQNDFEIDESWTEEVDPYGQDQLLMIRDMHLCAYKDFEPEFQKLFNEDSPILFQNNTLFYNFLNEKSCIELSESFVHEILSFKHFDQTLNNANAIELNMSQKRREQLALGEWGDGLVGRGKYNRN